MNEALDHAELLARANIARTWEDHRAVLVAHEPFLDFEYQLEDVDGLRYICVSGEPIFGADGKFRGYRGTALNFTKRKYAEDELRQSRSMLAMAMRLGRVAA